MPNLTSVAHKKCQEILSEGDVAIDATAGNGHDTLFLAQSVGETGCVYAFDTQEIAINTTKHRLETAGFRKVHYINDSHSNMTESIKETHREKISVIMFNLGFLPGGDKTLTTQTRNTLDAIQQSIQMLKPGGVLSVLAYTGHPGGQEETDSVVRMLSSLDASEYEFIRIEADSSSKSPPQLLIVTKL